MASCYNHWFIKPDLHHCAHADIMLVCSASGATHAAQLSIALFRGFLLAPAMAGACAEVILRWILLAICCMLLPWLPVCVSTEKTALNTLVQTLGIPLGTAKQMVFKKRGLLKLTQSEIMDRLTQVADVVGVTTDQAIDMITIQPGLLFDTQVGGRRGSAT